MNIVVIPKNGLGDLVFTMPLMWSLRKAYPDANIHIRTAIANKELLDIIGGGFIFNCWSGDDIDIKGYWKKCEYQKSVNKKDLEWIDIDILLINEYYKIGIAKKEISELDTDPEIKNYHSHIHSIDKMLRYCDLLGIEKIKSFEFENFVPKKVDIPKPYCIIQLSNSDDAISKKYRNRAYSITQWIDYIDSLRDINKVLIGDESKFGLSKILESIPNTYNLLNKHGYSTDLLTYMSLAKEAEFVSSNDTGLLHLADAIGVKVIGLYNENCIHSYPCYPYHNKHNVIWREW